MIVADRLHGLARAALALENDATRGADLERPDAAERAAPDLGPRERIGRRDEKLVVLATLESQPREILCSGGSQARRQSGERKRALEEPHGEPAGAPDLRGIDGQAVRGVRDGRRPRGAETGEAEPEVEPRIGAQELRDGTSLPRGASGLPTFEKSEPDRGQSRRAGHVKAVARSRPIAAKRAPAPDRPGDRDGQRQPPALRTRGNVPADERGAGGGESLEKALREREDVAIAELARKLERELNRDGPRAHCRQVRERCTGCAPANVLERGPPPAKVDFLDLVVDVPRQLFAAAQGEDGTIVADAQAHLGPGVGVGTPCRRDDRRDESVLAAKLDRRRPVGPASVGRPSP